MSFGFALEHRKVLNSTSLRRSLPFAEEQRIPRERMVERLQQHYKIRDERVLTAMLVVPRHIFVSEALQGNAYGDHALPISSNQTISQPFIVARMTELLEADERSRVLEIGSGSGYQTAVLSCVAGFVFAIERLPELVKEAQSRMRQLGINNVSIHCFDGTLGWSAHAPYDGILVAAGGPEVPRPLLDQLKTGGRLVIPIGASREGQRLVRIIKTDDGFKQEDHGACSFVPLVGRYGWQQQ
jgi:protein-L-isoaspartate(D-aspartate) O-methyltransferase